MGTDKPNKALLLFCFLGFSLAFLNAEPNAPKNPGNDFPSIQPLHPNRYVFVKNPSEIESLLDPSGKDQISIAHRNYQRLDYLIRLNRSKMFQNIYQQQAFQNGKQPLRSFGPSINLEEAPSWYSPHNANELKPWNSIDAVAHVFSSSPIDIDSINRIQFPDPKLPFSAPSDRAQLNNTFSAMALNSGAIGLNALQPWTAYDLPQGNASKSKAEEIATSTLWNQSISVLLSEKNTSDYVDEESKNLKYGLEQTSNSVNNLRLDAKKLDDEKQNMLKAIASDEAHVKRAYEDMMATRVDIYGGKAQYAGHLDRQLQQKKEDLKKLESNIELVDANLTMMEKAHAYLEARLASVRKIEEDDPFPNMTINMQAALKPNFAAKIYAEVLGLKNLEQLPYSEALAEINKKLAAIYSGKDNNFFSMHNIYGLKDKILTYKSTLEDLKKVPTNKLSEADKTKVKDLELSLHKTHIELNEKLKSLLANAAYRKLSVNRSRGVFEQTALNLANGHMSGGQNTHSPIANSSMGDAYADSQGGPSAIEQKESSDAEFQKRILTLINPDWESIAPKVSINEQQALHACINDVLEAHIKTGPEKFKNETDFTQFAQNVNPKIQECVNTIYSKYEHETEPNKNAIFEQLSSLSTQMMDDFFKVESEDFLRAQAFGIEQNLLNRTMQAWNAYGQKQILESKLAAEGVTLTEKDAIEAHNAYLDLRRNTGKELQEKFGVSAKRDPDTGLVELNLSKAKVFGPDGFMNDDVHRAFLESLSPATFAALERLENIETCDIGKTYCEPVMKDVTAFPPPEQIGDTMFVLNHKGEMQQYSKEDYVNGVSAIMNDMNKVVEELNAEGEDIGKFKTAFKEQSKNIGTLFFYNEMQKVEGLTEKQKVAMEKLISMSKTLVDKYGFGRVNSEHLKGESLIAQEKLVELLKATPDATLRNAQEGFTRNKELTSQIYINLLSVLPIGYVGSLLGTTALRAGGLLARGTRLDQAVVTFSNTAATMGRLKRFGTFIKNASHIGKVSMDASSKLRSMKRAESVARLRTQVASKVASANTALKPKIAGPELAARFHKLYNKNINAHSKKMLGVILGFQGFTTAMPVLFDAVGQIRNGSERGFGEIFGESLGIRFAEGFTPLATVRSTGMMFGLAKGGEVFKTMFMGKIKEKITRQGIAAATTPKFLKELADDIATNPQLIQGLTKAQITAFRQNVTKQLTSQAGKSLDDVIKSASPELAPVIQDAARRTLNTHWTRAVNAKGNWDGNMAINSITIPGMSIPAAKAHWEKHNELSNKREQKLAELQEHGIDPQKDHEYKDLNARYWGHIYEASTDLIIDAGTTFGFALMAAEVFRENYASPKEVQAAQDRLKKSIETGIFGQTKWVPTQFNEQQRSIAMATLLSHGEVKTGKIPKEAYDVIIKKQEADYAALPAHLKLEAKPIIYTHNPDGTMTIQLNRVTWLAKALSKASQIDFGAMLRAAGSGPSF